MIEGKYGDPIPAITNLYIDLLKMCYEGTGDYLLETNNKLEYKNYYVVNPSLGGNISLEPGDIQPGKYKPNNTNYNIDNACSWIIKYSTNSSQHACAKYVRMAIEAGGISTNGRPGWAWQYIKYLPTIGFKFIGFSNNSYESQNGKYTPYKGDIAVYPKGGDTSLPGHICMWTGNQWVSDFKQRNMIVYQNTPKAYIFRFNG